MEIPITHTTEGSEKPRSKYIVVEERSERKVGDAVFTYKKEAGDIHRL